MNLILYFLILCNLLIPVFFVLRSCFSKRGLKIDHNLLFSLAFVFYCVLPFILGVLEYKKNDPAMNWWHECFNRLSVDNLFFVYMLSCLLFYLSFVAGSLLSRRISINQSSKKMVFNRDILEVFFIIGLIFTGILAYEIRDHFFSGYLKGAYIGTLKGQFTAGGIFILTIALIYSTKKQEEYCRLPRFSRVVFNRYFVVYFVISILLLSLGGRMFFLSSVLMLFVYRTVYFKRVRLTSFLLFICIAVILAPFLAELRTGRISGLSQLMNIHYIKYLTHILFTDTLFISAGIFDFLSQNTLQIINFPELLLSQFIKIIPSCLFPTKTLFVLQPADSNFYVYSPFGAMHVFIPILTNFGLIGLVAFPFLLSVILELLKKKKTYLCKVMYIMISGWIAISLFRDFDSAIVKLIIEFSIIIPIIIALVMHIVSIAARSSPNIQTTVALPFSGENLNAIH